MMIFQNLEHPNAPKHHTEDCHSSLHELNPVEQNGVQIWQQARFWAMEHLTTSWKVSVETIHLPM
jgi:hypothetical protein